MEPREIYLVLAVFLLEGDQALKAVAPKDLPGQVGAPRLRGHAGTLDDALADAV